MDLHGARPWVQESGHWDLVKAPPCSNSSAPCSPKGGWIQLLPRLCWGQGHTRSRAVPEEMLAVGGQGWVVACWSPRSPSAWAGSITLPRSSPRGKFGPEAPEQKSWGAQRAPRLQERPGVLLPPHLVLDLQDQPRPLLHSSAHLGLGASHLHSPSTSFPSLTAPQEMSGGAPATSLARTQPPDSPHMKVRPTLASPPPCHGATGAQGKAQSSSGVCCRYPKHGVGPGGAPSGSSPSGWPSLCSQPLPSGMERS